MEVYFIAILFLSFFTSLIIFYCVRWYRFLVGAASAHFTREEIKLIKNQLIRSDKRYPSSRIFFSPLVIHEKILRLYVFKSKTKTPLQTEKVIRILMRRRDSLVLGELECEMKSSYVLKKNDRIQLKTAFGAREVYQSTIVEKKEEGILITYPTPVLKRGKSWRSEKIYVFFTVDGDAQYQFTTKANPSYWNHAFKSIMIFHSDQCLRIQRRKSLRIPASLSVIINPKENTLFDIEKGESMPDASIETIDISRGGIQFRDQTKYERKQSLNILIDINGESHFLGVTVRYSLFDKEKKSFYTGVSFKKAPGEFFLTLETLLITSFISKDHHTPL